VIADGHPDNAFVTITVRIGHGRDEVTRRRIGQMMFDAIRAYLAPVFDASPLAISLEVQEINPAFSFKQNNLHSIVPERAAAQEPVG
jgi:5-oxopent-3-ene-1,2,5-tricarboxylate decarboxylase/2-hydroxyhepta-2,4-diene-1,7-dioate isomerase